MGHYRGIGVVTKVTEHAAEFAEVEGGLAAHLQEGFALLVQMTKGFLYINVLLMHMHQ